MTDSEKPWYTSTIVAFLRHDVPAWIDIPPAAVTRDIIELEFRVAHEGESFLTKTLPEFGKAFDFALQERSPLTVSGFKKRPRSALPAFLQALLERVFTDEGHMRPDPCINSIRLVRQLCYWCKKVEKGFNDESLQRTISEFIEVDNALPAVGDIPDRGLLGYARETVRQLIGSISDVSNLFPRHGPGAVAWRQVSARHAVGTKRDLQKRCYKHLERLFRPVPWFFSLRDVSENPSCVLHRFQSKYGLDRMSWAEKDSRGPRLIGLAPAEYMWCQQALKGWLYHRLEHHPLTRGRVNFTDQSVNQELTTQWSRYDTLDMSSASDRVSLSLVRALFRDTWILPWLEACRTPGVVLPDGSVHYYKKFAPMGSAVCFPVEALVFYALAVSTLIVAGYPFLLALKNVFVYGDDLVVPHGYFTQLVQAFERFGLKFSDNKCCTSGKFRESCGVDAYDAHNVTPIRLRKPYAMNGEVDYISIVEHANALYDQGYFSAACVFRWNALRNFASLKALRIPFSPYALPILSWLSYTQSTAKSRNSFFSTRFVLGWRFFPKWEKTPAAEERCHLRESLATKGPVGRFSPSDPSQRLIALRFVGSLRKKWVPLADVPQGLRGQKTTHRLPVDKYGLLVLRGRDFDV